MQTANKNCGLIRLTAEDSHTGAILVSLGSIASLDLVAQTTQ
jgi:hypothetical protein